MIGWIGKGERSGLDGETVIWDRGEGHGHGGKGHEIRRSRIGSPLLCTKSHESMYRYRPRSFFIHREIRDFVACLKRSRIGYPAAM